MATLSPDISFSHHYLSSILDVPQKLLCWTLTSLLTYFCLVHICLVIRYFKTKFGKRIKAEGTRAILITGATSGLGLVAAKYFYKLGFSVIACYYNSEEPGYAELLELKNEEGRSQKHLMLVAMDVRSSTSIENASNEIDRFLSEYEVELYCLLNNAGISRVGPFELSSRKSIRDDIETNLLGLSMVTRQFLMKIVQSKGRVVNVSSGLFAFPIQGMTVYGCTKSAIAYFSDALHEDIKRYGASCHSIMPGNFITASNIMEPRVQSWQETERQLTDEEKIVYRAAIEGYSKLMNNLVTKKQFRSKSTDQTAKSDQLLGQPTVKARRKRSFWKRLLGWYLGILSGGGSGSSLEESGVINGYEQAVCLVDPPRSLYAGNFYFTYFFGPIVDYLPRIFLRLMIPMMNKSSSLI